MSKRGSRSAWYLLLLITAVLVSPSLSSGQEFKKWEAATAKFKRWLDSVGPTGTNLWLRLDRHRRPYRVYVGQRFYQTDYKRKKELIEVFSRYLSGHPEKFMLIDIFDVSTKKHIGEFGWGGFKLYSQPATSPSVNGSGTGVKRGNP